MASPFLLVADAIGPGLLGGPQWGIFSTSGQPVIVADSVNAVDISEMWKISDYPQQEGAFMSYNKVKAPYDAPVEFLSNQTRWQLLPQLKSICASLSLVSVVMPEVVYPSANLVGYKLRRAVNNGVTLVLVIVYVREVRIVAAGMTSNSQTTAGSTGGSTAGSTGGSTAGSTGGSNTQSTNAASPTQSGQTQAEAPAPVSTPSPTTDPAPPLPASQAPAANPTGEFDTGLTSAPTNDALPGLPPPNPDASDSYIGPF